MAKLTGFGNSLKGAKTRVLVFLVLALVIVGVGFGLWRLLKKDEAPVSEAALQQAPKLTSTPGTGEPTREYLKVQQQADIEHAQEAIETGGTALPTLSGGGYAGSEEFAAGPQEAGKPGCSSEELQRARAAGVKVEELRCKGCSPETLKTAGYTAAELMEAGFTAKELKAIDFNAADLRIAGFDPQELLGAGFTNAQLENAGFAGAGLVATTVTPGNKTGDCSVEALIKAKNSGVDATALAKKGCDLGNLKQAGFTAKELRDAGFSAKDLAAAGFTAAELRDAGFSAKELKDAGFTAKQLKEAGFNAAELKAAGFSAGELRRAGFSAEDLKNAGFSAADLREAGFSAQELKDAGYTMDELRGAGFSDGELVRAGFQPQQVDVAAAATVTPPPGQASAVELPAIPAGGSSDVEALDRLRQYQAAELSRQQQEELVQQMQQAMATQAHDLFTSWQGSPGIVLVETPKAPEASKTAQVRLASASSAAGKAGAGGNGGAAGGAPIIKAGAVMFAVLQTSVNSDEQSPVMATIVDGKLKGAKLIGRFTRVDKRVVLEFNTINIQGMPSSVAVNAVAIDPQTARTALASDVDSHYMLRYGTLFASAFLTGVGNAISQSDTTTTTSLFGNITTHPTYSVGQQAMLALGQVGTQYGQVMANNFTTPPTVKVDSGTGIGILFMQDVSLASTNTPTASDALPASNPAEVGAPASPTGEVGAGTNAGPNVTLTSETPTPPGSTPTPASVGPDLAALLAQQQQRQAQQAVQARQLNQQQGGQGPIP